MTVRHWYSTLLLIVLLSVYSYPQLYTDWKWLNPKPQGNTIRWVKMFSATKFYAVGYAGTFMKTTDGGNTGYFHHTIGRKAVSGQSASAYDAYFFDTTTGVVVGALGSIARTTNGGLTFDTAVTNPIGTGITIYKVFFVNNNLGFVVGTSGTLAKTTDGGINWSLMTSGSTASLYDIWSPDGNTICIIAASGSFRKSTDGGTTWTAYATGVTTAQYKMLFIDPNTAYVAGASGGVRVTTDQGATWAAANTGLPTTVTFYDIDNIGSAIYLTGASNTMYKSTNMGASWDTLGFLAPVAQQPWTSTYYSTDMRSTDDTLFTGGAFGLINVRYSPSQRTVLTQFIHPGQYNDAWVNNSGSKIILAGAPGIANGTFDQIQYSTNGGQSWMMSTFTSKRATPSSPVFVPEQEESALAKGEEPKATNPLAAFNSIYMFNENNGFAVGTYSAVYKTTNGGVSWDSVVTTIAAGQNLSKVTFVNANTGWIFSKTTSNNGTIWKTTDGGATWAQQSLGSAITSSATQIYAAHMLNENLGYVVNFTPVPFKTTDGGATWTAQTLVDGYTAGYMYDIQMFDENNGYVCGGSGHLYKTTNGGANWDTVSVPTRSYNLMNLHFFTKDIGMISATSGLMLFTTNGGSLWEVTNNSAATNYALSSTAVNNGHVSFYVAGSSGYTLFREMQIVLPANLTLTAPNGGEIWTPGAQKNITWTSSGVANVALKYTTDNGTSWLPVAASLPATPATYTWTVPNTVSSQCKVKVINTADTTLFDVSDAVFSIAGCATFGVQEGWFMVSVPLLAPSMTDTVLFPSANSYAYAFEYQSGYVVNRTLANGKGYFVRFPATTNVTICGAPVNSTTIALAQGWNMIGPYNFTAPVGAVTTIPAGILNSYFFTFENGYIKPQSLTPGRGYWIRASQAGTLELHGGVDKAPAAVNTVPANAGKIMISDAEGASTTLYALTSAVNLENYDLPPVPPAGLFDARFSTQRGAEALSTGSKVIQFSGAYPITITAQGIELTLRDNVTGGKLINTVLKNGQSFVISNPAISAVETSTNDIPSVYELAQNYPNPFNPSTTIKFGLPEKARATVTIYNQLGEKVAVVLSQELEAGYHAVQFNAGNLASGIYFYELKTEKFSSVKKLMLLK